MEKLEGWEFIYSPHLNIWLTTRRENRNMLYNDHTNKEILKSKNIDTLIELVIKTQGKQDKINTLLKNNK